MAVLVAYASKHGSTRGIAEAIGARLRDRGIDADVRPVGEEDGVDTYEALVIGSAVYLGAWLKEAVAFLDRHADARIRVPTWLFSSGPTADDPMELAVSAKVRQRLDALGARDHHLFRGALDPRQLGLLERTAIRAAKSPIGDHREWLDVERWADEIAAQLLASRA